MVDHTLYCTEGEGTPVWIGLGSNSEDALERLDEARAGIAALDGLTIVRVSPVYTTEPQDYADQPYFHNQVLEARADAAWGPVPLMLAMLGLESQLGRVRSADPALRFGPRAIDIDMLLYGEDGKVVSDDPTCLLPHPRLTRRAFWLVPLRDIAPRLRIQGESVDALLARLTWSVENNVICQEQPGQAGVISEGEVQ